MIKIIKPKIEELWFKQSMMEDEATMSYNHGIIPFPKSRWQQWYDKWMYDDTRYYRYLFDTTLNCFIGEICFYLDEGCYMSDIIIHARYRGLGYGTIALDLLCKEAKKHGIKALYDNIALDNPSIHLFLKHGFQEIDRNQQAIIVYKKL